MRRRPVPSSGVPHGLAIVSLTCGVVSRRVLLLRGISALHSLGGTDNEKHYPGQAAGGSQNGTQK
jgi:hypothetical protein